MACQREAAPEVEQGGLKEKQQDIAQIEPEAVGASCAKTGTPFVSCPISRTGFDDLFHFSATCAGGHHGAVKYHEQIQADCSGIGGYFGWHAKCTT
jgi:hypothetical protein